MSALDGSLSGVRPALKPGLLPLWRDRDTVQIGIDPRRAVALSGMAGAAWLMSVLDGSRDRDQVIALAAEQGIPARLSERVLTILAAAGVLNDFPAETLRELSAAARSRLAAELATASLASGDSDGGARTLARRLGSLVRIHGHGRIATAIAEILLTSGVAEVEVGLSGDPAAANDDRADGAGAGAATRASARQIRETGPAASAADSPPSSASQPGQRCPADALAGRGARTRRASPGSATSPGTTRAAARRRAGGPASGTWQLPDLAILVGQQPPELPGELVTRRVPHLSASANEAIGFVGPLVLPGRTACLRCLDLARAERDPAWPLILAQLAGKRPEPLACDAALATAVAAQAASQALAFIDAPPGGVTLNGTLELVLPSWQWRRRSWLPRPDCSCRAGSAG